MKALSKTEKNVDITRFLDTNASRVGLWRNWERT